MRVLVIDSDCHLVEMLVSWLRTLGYEVRRAYTGAQAKSEWVEHRPDLVILDTGLKDVDALAMCRQLRTVHDALLLVLTEEKGVEDEVRCLESGADDYLRKPFFPAQLLARIHAVCRRTRSTLAQRPSSVLTVGPLRVDGLHNEVTIGGKTSHLTPTESKLLHVLAINVNRVCTAEEIVTHIWGYEDEGESVLIKAHIRHLRQKVEVDPSAPHYICTVPGVGYMLRSYALDEKASQGVAVEFVATAS